MAEHARRRLLKEADGSLYVAAEKRMVDGLIDVTLLREPPACAAVQLPRALWPGCRQLPAEDVGEELVVAVPAPLIVQGGDEEVRGLQLGQHRVAVGLPGHGVTKGTAQAP